MDRRLATAILTTLLLLLAGCSADRTGEDNHGSQAGTQASNAEIPWFQGSIDAAFKRASEEGKPLFLYWGAEWCPYCKQLEATIFVRDEFIGLSQQFIPVDMSNGDSETIRYADQFKIYGLPTVIVFSPDGTEMTRIRGGMDMEEYASVLELTLNQVRPVAGLVSSAIAGEPLQTADWQLLSSYSWGQDRGQALGDEQPSAVLMQLVEACPAGERLAHSRLALAALDVWLSEDKETRDAELGPRLLPTVQGVLSDDSLAQANLAMLAARGSDIVELAEGEQQLELQKSLLSLYRPAIADSRLNLLKRATVLSGWAEVATVLLEDGERLDEQDIAWGRQQAGEMVAALDAYQVHPGVNSLWTVYYDLGLTEEARETLALGIDRSRAPFYFMSAMGYVELEAGNSTEALAWYRKAWESTSAPLDRVRWGGGYVRRLVNLAPEDTPEIKRASSALLADLASQPDGLNSYQRFLDRFGGALLEWAGDDPTRGEVVAALRKQMESSCGELVAEACRTFLDASGTEAAG